MKRRSQSEYTKIAAFYDGIRRQLWQNLKKANSVGEWLDQRLNLTINKVMMTEYWIPKDINFLWAMGVLLATTFGILVISGIILNDVLQTRC